MKDKIKISIFSILWIGLVWTSYSQESKLTKASEEYSQLNYVNAQSIYLSVAEKGYESEELFKKLGNTYYFNAQYDEASKWYKRLFEKYPNQPSEILLRYSQALRAIGSEDQSKTYYNEYVSKGGRSLEMKAIDYLSLIEENSGRYELTTISSLYDEEKISFGQTQLGDKLIYASTEDRATFLNRRSGWDGLSFLSLYEVALDSSNQVQGKPKKLRGELKSKYHESSPVFTQDGETMYFSRSNLTAEKNGNDQNLKIYRSKKEGGKWQEAEELPFNSDDYSSAHPALSPDGSKLYFSSDRPGGYGASDLYVVKISSDGSVGEPVNLGASINTSGKETFPFITADNELYFSSDGHFGLGGLDVFYVKIEESGYGNLLNIGRPINTYADDFAFGIDEETRRGFISSNRTDTDGRFVRDNIYTFLETSPIKDVYKAEIEGYVTDKQTGDPIPGAMVSLTDLEGTPYAALRTDEKGYYTIEINKFKIYTLRATHDLYDADEKLSEAGLDLQKINFHLQKNKEELSEGTDLAKVLNIPMIYFDFDKSNIRPDAEVELQKVVEVMNQYPELKIDIRSHTDSRGSDAYNEALSDRRAKSTMHYLISQGISKDRLTSKGYGESQLVNGCSNGVPCSKAEHQANRRSEFIVVE